MTPSNADNVTVGASTLLVARFSKASNRFSVIIVIVIIIIIIVFGLQPYSDIRIAPVCRLIISTLVIHVLLLIIDPEG